MINATVAAPNAARAVSNPPFALVIVATTSPSIARARPSLARVTRVERAGTTKPARAFARSLARDAPTRERTERTARESVIASIVIASPSRELGAYARVGVSGTILACPRECIR